MLAALLVLLLQDRIEKKCDCAVVETAAYCLGCDADASDGKHEGHPGLGKALFCVKKVFTNG